MNDGLETQTKKKQSKDDAMAHCADSRSSHNILVETKTNFLSLENNKTNFILF